MNKQKRNNSLTIQFIGEFIGTGLITFFEIACKATSQLTSIHLNYLESNFICSISLAIAIYISSSLSDSHLNPSITVCFWMFNNFCKKKVFYYIISQLLGSFSATSLIYYMYINILRNFEIKHNILKGDLNSIYLASIFASYPNKEFNLLRLLNIEILIMSIFVILLMLIANTKNKLCTQCSFANNHFIIGMITFLLRITIYPIIPFTLNPACDLSPRIFLFIAGWGKIVFTAGISNLYFLIPIIGPLVGGILGVYIYKIIFNYVNQ